MYTQINLEGIFTTDIADIGIETQSQFEKLNNDAVLDIQDTEILVINESLKVSEKPKGASNIPSVKEFLAGATPQDNKNNKTTFLKAAQQKEEKRLSNKDTNFPYIARNIMTDAEKQLYFFMSNNLCQVERLAIFPKVRLADIIELDKAITYDKDYLWKITNKHVDYVICNNSTLNVICVVELDDYTHENDEAKIKDMFIMQALYAAGIPTVRIRTRIKNISRSDLELVDDYINKALAKPCPRCGKPMIPRKSNCSFNRGHRFYACSDFKYCKTTIDIDPVGEKLP